MHRSENKATFHFKGKVIIHGYVSIRYEWLSSQNKPSIVLECTQRNKLPEFKKILLNCGYSPKGCSGETSAFMFEGYRNVLTLISKMKAYDYLKNNNDVKDLTRMQDFLVKAIKTRNNCKEKANVRNALYIDVPKDQLELIDNEEKEIEIGNTQYRVKFKPSSMPNVEAFISELFRMLLGNERVARCQPLYNLEGISIGLATKILELKTLNGSLQEKKKDKQFYEGMNDFLIKGGYGKIEAASMCLADTGVSWDNVYVAADAVTLGRCQFNRSLWPIMNRYFRVNLKTDFSIVKEEDIIYAPSYKHIKTDKSFHDEYMETMVKGNKYEYGIEKLTAAIKFNELQGDGQFKGDLFYTYLKFILLGQEVFKVRLNDSISSRKLKQEILDYLCNRQVQYMKILTRSSIFREFLLRHLDEITSELKTEFEALNLVYEDENSKHLVINFEEIQTTFEEIKKAANISLFLNIMSELENKIKNKESKQQLELEIQNLAEKKCLNAVIQKCGLISKPSLSHSFLKLFNEAQSDENKDLFLLMYKAIENLNDNLAYAEARNKKVVTLEQLMHIQQKRDVINEIDEELDRLKYCVQSVHKVHAYRYLRSVLERPGNIFEPFISIYEKIKREAILVNKDNEPVLTVEQAITQDRRVGLTEPDSKTKLNQFKALPNSSSFFNQKVTVVTLEDELPVDSLADPNDDDIDKILRKKYEY